MQQAADVLLLLSSCNLGETARMRYTALFARRLERAYGRGGL